MDSLLAVLRHSLSWTRKSLRNQTMEARRTAAPLEGSRGRRGPKERGDCRGLLAKVDLKESLEGEGEGEVEERER